MERGELNRLHFFGRHPPHDFDPLDASLRRDTAHTTWCSSLGRVVTVATTTCRCRWHRTINQGTGVNNGWGDPHNRGTLGEPTQRFFCSKFPQSLPYALTSYHQRYVGIDKCTGRRERLEYGCVNGDQASRRGGLDVSVGGEGEGDITGE